MPGKDEYTTLKASRIMSQLNYMAQVPNSTVAEPLTEKAKGRGRLKRLPVWKQEEMIQN
jgi:hypothetical protein